jgi:hypothetical protein
MLRSELVEATNEVLDLLKRSGVHELFARSPPKDSGKIVLVMQSLARLESRLSAKGREVMEIMGLAELLTPEFWTIVLSSEARDDRTIGMRFQLRFVVQNLPKLLGLLRRSADEIPSTREAENVDGTYEALKLTVILPEDEKNVSSPTRIATIMDAIGGLYSVVCEINKFSTGTLAVAACDSGSDKIFDFVGLDKAIEAVKSVICEIWDRIIFFRERKGEKSLEMILDSLSVVERINLLRASGDLGPQEAELLKRQALKAATGFYNAGALIPEIDARAKVEPRSLAAPERKLLAGPTDSSDFPPRNKEEDFPPDQDDYQT